MLVHIAMQFNIYPLKSVALQGSWTAESSVSLSLSILLVVFIVLFHLARFLTFLIAQSKPSTLAKSPSKSKWCQVMHLSALDMTMGLAFCIIPISIYLIFVCI